MSATAGADSAPPGAPGAPEASRAPDAAEASRAPEAPEASRAPDAPEASRAPDARDAPGAARARDLTELELPHLEASPWRSSARPRSTPGRSTAGSTGGA